MGVQIIGAGEVHDPRSLELATRAGERIPNVREFPLSPTVMKTRIRQHRESHPHIVVRSAASVYNCAGMVFASRRTAIDIDLVRRILKEDGYRQIASEDMQMGDIVLYADQSQRVSHVGMIASMHVGMIASMPVERQGQLNPVRILSQWGSDGEYFHAPLDVPALYGRPSEYWTDTVSAP